MESKQTVEIIQPIANGTEKTITVSREGNRQGSFFTKGIVRVILLAWGICVLFPMVWTVYTSFKTNKEFFAGAWSLPKNWNFENYVTAWNESHVASYVWNSVFVAIIASIISLLLASMTSYVIARFEFKGRKFLFWIYVSSMMIPTVLGMIPLFFMLNSLGLLNSLVGLGIIYAAGSIPFGVFILTGFFQTLPKELDESAAIDGCGYFRTFFQIMLPLSKAGLITVGIMNMLNFWNEYFLALVFVQQQDKYTLPVGIAYMVQAAEYKSNWGSVFAALVISMIPIVIIYAIFQKRITEGMTAGAVKG